MTTQLGNHTQAVTVTWQPFQGIAPSTPQPLPTQYPLDTSAPSAPHLLDTPMTSFTPAPTNPLVQSKYLWSLSELKHPWASIRQGPVQSPMLRWLPNVLTHLLAPTWASMRSSQTHYSQSLPDFSRLSKPARVGGIQGRFLAPSDPRPHPQRLGRTPTHHAH